MRFPQRERRLPGVDRPVRMAGLGIESAAGQDRITAREGPETGIK